MKPWLITLTFAMCCALPARGEDFADVEPPDLSVPVCFDGSIRVSALISTGEKVKVGIVETATGASFLVSPGEFAGAVEVVDANYEKETVTLKRGEEVCALALSSDPDAARIAAELQAPADDDYRGEAIEKFLSENPDALRDGMVKFPVLAMSDEVIARDGLDAYLRAHPDIAAKSEIPAVGKGEGIESYLKEHPEIKIDEEIPPGSLGAGIDAGLKDNPEILTNLLSEPEPEDDE